jgi:ribonucleoside-diphosphate reductase alpha chain
MDKELAANKSTGSKDNHRDGKRAVRKTKGSGGLSVNRYFTTPGVDPADEIAWELRTAGISGEDGKSVFEQKNI